MVGRKGRRARRGGDVIASQPVQGAPAVGGMEQSGQVHLAAAAEMVLLTHEERWAS